MLWVRAVSLADYHAAEDNSVVSEYGNGGRSDPRSGHGTKTGTPGRERPFRSTAPAAAGKRVKQPCDRFSFAWGHRDR